MNFSNTKKKKTFSHKTLFNEDEKENDGIDSLNKVLVEI